jgi:hypothetical protein
MHIPIHVKIICNQDDVYKIKDFLTPNKLFHIMEFHDVARTSDENTVVLDISGVVFDEDDIPLIENSLKHYGEVRLNRGKLKVFTLNTILSALIVAGIVSVALLAHGFNEDLFNEVFEHHNTRIILETTLTIGLSATAGFLLELLIIYREKKITRH